MSSVEITNTPLRWAVVENRGPQGSKVLAVFADADAADTFAQQRREHRDLAQDDVGYFICLLGSAVTVSIPWERG